MDAIKSFIMSSTSVAKTHPDTQQIQIANYKKQAKGLLDCFFPIVAKFHKVECEIRFADFDYRSKRGIGDPTAVRVRIMPNPNGILSSREDVESIVNSLKASVGADHAAHISFVDYSCKTGQGWFDLDLALLKGLNVNELANSHVSRLTTSSQRDGNLLEDTGNLASINQPNGIAVYSTTTTTTTIDQSVASPVDASHRVFEKDFNSIKGERYSVSGLESQYTGTKLSRLEFAKMNTLEYLLEQMSARCKSFSIGSNVNAFISEERAVLLDCILVKLKDDNEKACTLIPTRISTLLCDLLQAARPYPINTLATYKANQMVKVMAVDNFKTFSNASAFGEDKKAQRTEILKYLVSVMGIENLPPQLQDIAFQEIGSWEKIRTSILSSMDKINHQLKALETQIGKGEVFSKRFYNQNDPAQAHWKVYNDLIEEFSKAGLDWITSSTLITMSDERAKEMYEKLEQFSGKIVLSFHDV